MTDNGSGGDEVAGDGIFSGTIPGQATGTMVAFYAQATDNFSPASTAIFPSDAPARECLVRVGEAQPVGNFPVYRIWMTQATLGTWNNRSKLNNTPLDITFVLGNQRVIYNAQGLYAGSPYIAPGIAARPADVVGTASSCRRMIYFLENGTWCWIGPAGTEAKRPRCRSKWGIGLRTG